MLKSLNSFSKNLNIRILLKRMNSTNVVSNDEIEFKKINQVGLITLNRPKQLNSLNLNMVVKMKDYLEQIENDENVRAVLVKGAGESAFCAGGDVKSIRELCLNGQKQKAMEFFKQEYKLNYKIANLKKPYIALINGVTMGGGVGVSVHGRYRIATEKTLFAMPETAIGFFADVGGSYFLPRLKNNIGLYLALTGNRLRGEDVKRTGIATHFTRTNNLANLENKILNCTNLNDKVLENILNEFNEQVNGEFDSHNIATIFNESSLEKIIENLQKDNTDWSKQQLKLLSKMSPTSLKLTVKQLELGSQKNLKQCLEMEYQLGLRFVQAGSDFIEGVRCVLVDKGDKPKWNPPSIEQVDDKKINWFFAPLEEDDKLDLSEYNSKL